MPRRKKPVAIKPLPSPKLTPVNIVLSIILFTIIGAFIGSLTTFFILKSQKPPAKTANDFIKEYYDVENAVHVSPHSIRKAMDKGDKSFILVDLRSPQEYEKEHIIGAINIPAYKDPETSAYNEVDRIVGEFNKLPKGKDIVVYCYSMPCMTGRKIGLMLTQHNIFVKHLNIGWNEWRYYWNLWNHDGEAPSVVEDYIIGGKDPGTPKILPTLAPSAENNATFTPCTKGDYGC